MQQRTVTINLVLSISLMRRSRNKRCHQDKQALQLTLTLTDVAQPASQTDPGTSRALPTGDWLTQRTAMFRNFKAAVQEQRLDSSLR